MLIPIYIFLSVRRQQAKRSRDVREGETRGGEEAGKEKGPERIRKTLDVFPRIEYQSVSDCKIVGVAEADVRIVGHMGPEVHLKKNGQEESKAEDSGRGWIFAAGLRRKMVLWGSC